MPQKIKITFDQLDALIRKLYGDEEFEKVIELIDIQGEDFPNQRLYLTYWQISMAARTLKPTLVFHFLDELIQQGLWISEELLRTSPALESMWEYTDFEQRVQTMTVLQTAERTQTLPLITLRQEDRCSEGKPCPLLIGLHDNDSNAVEGVYDWKSIAARGWLVGVPQSTQAKWSRAYVWEDPILAQEEISGHLKDLREKYFVDERKTVLAGNRHGGEMAMWLPINGGVDVRGFVALNPLGAWLNDLQGLMLKLQSIPEWRLRGSILVNDLNLKDHLAEIADLLTTFGIPTRLFLFEGSTRTPDSSYEAVLLEGLDYVLS